MSITSILFIFAFLPASLAVYYIADDKAKEYVLLAVSLLFYAVGSLRYFLLFAGAICVTVLIGRCMAAAGARRESAGAAGARRECAGAPAGNAAPRGVQGAAGNEAHSAAERLLFAAGILFNVGLLGYYKYADFAIDTVNRALGKSYPLQNLLLPLGISFFTFKAISYLADIYHGTADLDQSPVHDLLYLSFFAQIQSGPITRYGDLRYAGDPISPGNATSLRPPVAGNTARRWRISASFTSGVYRFLIGFNKKVLLANMLANITNEVFSAQPQNFSTAYAWLGSVCYSLQIFFDFAGYSDMAIGISQMFGYPCMENFNYPYMTESVSRFWRRWHISLSQWFRDYIYIPLGGSRTDRRWKVFRNLLAVWLLTGIWHGASWRFVLWGLGYFVLIAFEKATGLPGRLKTKFGRIIYRVLTLLFINFEWVIFRADSLRSALSFIKKMFICAPNHLADKRALFLLKDYRFFLIGAVILCFPVIPYLDRKLEGKRTAHTIFEVLLAAAVVAGFVWGLSFIVAGQNNPFAYANF